MKNRIPKIRNDKIDYEIRMYALRTGCTFWEAYDYILNRKYNLDRFF